MEQVLSNLTTEQKLNIAIEALQHIMWHKECGCDYRDPETNLWINDSAAERDAMYKSAKEALTKIGEPVKTLGELTHD